jgi:hypothetical protein
MDRFLPQSASILREFARDTNQSPPFPTQKLHECIDSSFVILVRGHEYLKDFQEDGIKKEFLNQRDHMDGEFIKQRKYIDGRFESMGGRFESMEARLGRLEAMTLNSEAQRAWHEIYPVGVYDRDHGYRVHDDLPKTVKDFWKLNRRNRGQ